MTRPPDGAGKNTNGHNDAKLRKRSVERAVERVSAISTSAASAPSGKGTGVAAGAAASVVARDGADGEVEAVTSVGAVEAGMSLATMEQRLRASEDRYRALALATGQITWTARGNGGDGDGRDWAIFTGQDAGTAGVWSWLDALHSDDRARVADAWDAAVAGRRIFETDCRVRRYDGIYRWLLVRSVPVLEVAGAVREWVGTATDITDRKQAEDALHSSEAQLATDLADTQQVQRIGSQLIQEDKLDDLYEQILAAAITVMRSDMGSMQLLDPERNALRLLAWKGFDPASAAFWEWVRIDSDSSCGVALHTRARVVVADVEDCDFMAGTQDLHSYRLSGIRAVQSTPLVSRGGHIVGMISTHWRTPHQPSERALRLLDLLARQAADLIERKQVEQALHASEEKFRTLADNIPLLTWMAEPDGHIFWYNQRWYEYTGTTPESQEGWGWQSVHDPAMLPQVVEQWRRSLDTGESFEMVFPLRGADGVFRPFLTRIIAVKDARGRVVRWFGSNTDITEQRAIQAALEVANRVKDEFLGVASHELRTPLTSAKASVQIVANRLSRLIADDTADADTLRAQAAPLQAMLVRSDEAMDRLNRLVHDLLEVSRISAGVLELRTERVDLVAIVCATVNEQEPAWPDREVRLEGLLRCSGSRVEEAEATPSVWVEADADRVRQVVTNFLSNALKYAPPDQPISVRLDTEEAASSDGRLARISVQDMGPGLAPEQQALVFDRFYRVEGIEQQQGSGIGMGLGLYISRQIVELHGGQIGVESVLGAGSTFWCTLPLASE